MIRSAILLLLVSLHTAAHVPLQNWTTLNYETNHECFYSGIKRVYIPYPGIGSILCLKKAVTLLPDIQKSGNLIAGHVLGLMSAVIICTVGLIIATRLKIPGAQSTLGPELT